MSRTEQNPERARGVKKASSKKKPAFERVDVDLDKRVTVKTEGMSLLLKTASKGRFGGIENASQSVVIETIPGKGHTQFQKHKGRVARISDKNNRSKNTIDRITEYRASQILDEFSIPKNQLSSLHSKIVDLVRLSVSEALEIKATPDVPAAKVASLPEQAPEIYGGLRGSETPPEFVKRVYSPWLGQGLDRAHIKHIDPKLYTAIDNWTRKPGNEWPAEVDLPTRGEQTRRTIEQLKQEVPDGRIGKVLGDFTAREAQRIRAAVRRQEQKR